MCRQTRPPTFQETASAIPGNFVLTLIAFLLYLWYFICAFHLQTDIAGSFDTRCGIIKNAEYFRQNQQTFRAVSYTHLLLIQLLIFFQLSGKTNFFFLFRFNVNTCHNSICSARSSRGCTSSTCSAFLCNRKFSATPKKGSHMISHMESSNDASN